MIRRRVTWAVALAFAMTAAGCGDRSDPRAIPAVATAPTASATPASAPAPLAPPSEVSAAAAGSTASVAFGAPADATDIADLRSRRLMVPVQGIGAERLVDTYTQARAGGRAHDAIDILAARGTPVVAVEDGTVAKLFSSRPGGLTVYQFDPSGRFAYYYAHLDGYADGLAEGTRIAKGQVIGTVGSTGNASPDAPHLHFAIFRLGPERQWWKGEPLNPFLVWRNSGPK